MKVIGLTGGIGSGKSTVSQFLAELGAVIIDADRLGHEAFQPGSEIWREVVAAFGQEILGTGGEIDRKKLGDRVFGNAESLARLNQIMQPGIHDMVSARLKQYRQQGVGVVVIDAPMLFETGRPAPVDEVWVTVASEAAVLRRLRQRSGLSESETLARIRSQPSNEERVKHADVVVDTDCRLEELRSKVKQLWQKRLARFCCI